MPDPASAPPRRLPLLLAAAFLALWAGLAVHPVARDVWWAENIPVMAVFGLLALTWSRFRFSDAAYLLMSVWLVVHTVGGHYTFANVPFGWVTETFGFARNNFDRLGHLSIGLYAFPVAELLVRRRWAGPALAALFGLFALMALAAAYEIVEWWYAALAGGEAGAAFLGSQGDVWDAQKDMLCDTVGALAGLALFLAQGRRSG
jgi:putative membrane protein